MMGSSAGVHSFTGSSLEAGLCTFTSHKAESPDLKGRGARSNCIHVNVINVRPRNECCSKMDYCTSEMKSDVQRWPAWMVIHLRRYIFLRLYLFKTQPPQGSISSRLYLLKALPPQGSPSSRLYLIKALPPQGSPSSRIYLLLNHQPCSLFGKRELLGGRPWLWATQSH
ncbi:unnamed protein product [Boreogadus saida]